MIEGDGCFPANGIYRSTAARVGSNKISPASITAGATTLAEITAAGRPSILIPLPTAADNHQLKNAEALQAAGAAEVIEQKDLTADVLVSRIFALAADPERRQQMSAAARRVAKPDAAERIVDAVIRLAERRAS